MICTAEEERTGSIPIAEVISQGIAMSDDKQGRTGSATVARDVSQRRLFKLLNTEVKQTESVPLVEIAT